MPFIEENGIVYNVYETAGGTVITEYVSRYRVELASDRTSITANGVDKAVITARVYDYAGAFQAGDREIVFDIEGSISLVMTVAGVATLELTSGVVGEIDVKTDMPGMQNGAVVIHAG
jgi:hypothetical protein